MKNFRRILLVALVCVILLAMAVPQALAASAPARYDPAAEGILSGYLCLEEGYIRHLAPGVTLEQLNKLSLPGDLTADTEIVGTGTILQSAAAGQSLTAVVTGDVNGDGDASITDMLMLKGHILGTELTGAGLAAGDVNRDGDVSISDFLAIKSYLLEMSRIEFGKAEQAEPLRILAPGQTQDWITAAGYNIIASAKRNGHKLIAVILGAPSTEVRAAESLKFQISYIVIKFCF